MDQDTFKLGMAISLLVALISGNNIANAEVTHEPSSSPIETGIIGGSVSRSAFTMAVVNREPIDKITKLSNDKQHVYYFSDLKGLTGQTVTHRWLYNGQTMAELKFDVGAPRWRVWSNKTLLPDWIGEWTVVVIDELGQEVFRDSFEYVAAEPAVNP